MTDDITELRTDEFLFAGKRAVEFQEFLIRRAFGFFYGVWAVDFLLLVMGSFFLGQAADSVFTIIGIITGFFVSQRLFRRSKKTSRFRNSIRASKIKGSGSGARTIILITIAVYVILNSFILLDAADRRYVLDAGIVSIIILYSAGSFGTFYVNYTSLGRLTPEGLIAPASLFIGGISEVAASVAMLNQSFLLMIWTMVIASWMIASIISFYQSTEVLGGLDGRE